MKISDLFLCAGLSDAALADLRDAGRLVTRRYRRGEVILHAGDDTRSVGAVLSGAVLIESVGVTGDRAILGRVESGHVFAESYALAGVPLMVDAVCAEEGEVAFFDIAPLVSGDITDTAGGMPRRPESGSRTGADTATARDIGRTDARCAGATSARGTGVASTRGAGAADGVLTDADRVIAARLLTLAARKNLALSERIFCTSPKHIRERVSVYLAGQSARAGSRRFRIPYDRQQMADYLGVERTALSKELSKMRADGLIAYRKNEFTLLRGAEE